MNIDLVWPFLLVGLGAGGLYALMGCGVVLAYRASGYLHIAHAGVAMISGLSFVVIARSMPVVPAAIISISIGSLLSVGLYKAVFERLEKSSMAAKVVVSVAVGIGLQAVGGAILVNGNLLGTSRGATTTFFSESTRFTIFGGTISAQQLALPVVALAVFGAMQFALLKTDIGLALRASAQNQFSAELAGVPAAQVTLAAWLGVGVLGGLTGVLAVSASSFLVPTFLFAENIRGLAAALTGAFVDLKRMMIAAFALGIIEQEMVGLEPPWNATRGAVSFALITAVALFGLGRPSGPAERAEAAAV